MSHKLCIIGGGYVGLPLAVAFAQYFPVTVMTKSASHAGELSKGYDRTRSFSTEELQQYPIKFTSDIADGADADIYIVTVPTPVDDRFVPDLSPVEEATRSVASVLKQGDIVIYESTVYIGCTEEFCAPLLSELSGLTYNEDFFCGFSPERINPADTEHTIHNVVKIVSASRAEITEEIRKMYGKIVHAGIHVAPKIKVAEASKLIENIQRDVNIALMNELSQIFHAVGIDTNDVIQAASTKWNFLPFRPGLVGGHCIGVDPYYMIFNGEQNKVPLPLITLSRAINNGMNDYVVTSTVNLLEQRGIVAKEASVLMLGITFKEDCPDIRNSQSAVIHSRLKAALKNLDLCDPVADRAEVEHVYGIEMIDIDNLPLRHYDAVLITVAHAAYRKLTIQNLLKTEDGIVLDLKGILPKDESDFRL